jgi:hypothetical protein
VQITERVCLWYGSFRSRTVRVILVCDDKPRTRSGDDRGYGLPLITTDLQSSAEDLVARYASRWGIEQAFADARQIMGVGEARNRTRRAVERTVPFGLICAGKSTTMRILVGLTRPTSGSGTISGRRYVDLPNPGLEVGVLLDASAQHAGLSGEPVGADKPEYLPEDQVPQPAIITGQRPSPAFWHPPRYEDAGPGLFGISP